MYDLYLKDIISRMRKYNNTGGNNVCEKRRRRRTHFPSRLAGGVRRMCTTLTHSGHSRILLRLVCPIH